MIEDITKNIDNFLKIKIMNYLFFFGTKAILVLKLRNNKKIFKNTKEQKKKLDKFAAKIILDDFLEKI